MILETKRLCLRALEPNDLEDLSGMYSNQEVMSFIGTGVTFTKSQTEKSIIKWDEYEKEHGYSNWAVIRKEDGAFIGKCGLSELPDKSGIEISYILDEPYWGRGYATEISAAVLELGFSKFGMKKIIALVYPQNSPSIKVIEKLGMKYEKEAEFWGVKLLMYVKEK
jgi:ribosomal-protein-alanine N-acetyltransferase